MEKAIKIAIENGWKDWDYMPNIVIDKSDYVTFLKGDVPVEGIQKPYIILDPLFWQALGKGLGWEEDELVYLKECTTWGYQMHCFIDHLAEGNDIESFFAELTK